MDMVMSKKEEIKVISALSKGLKNLQIRQEQILGRLLTMRKK
jgi:hypothetical protein